MNTKTFFAMRALALLVFSPLVADAGGEGGTTFTCGEGVVAITNSSDPRDPYFSIQLSGAFGTRTYRLSVENEFLKARCELSASQEPLLVIQHACGGSGCADVSNWGILSMRTGEMLLRPDQRYKGNGKEAEGLLGHPGRPFSCPVSTKSGRAIPDGGEYCFVSPIERG